MLNPRNRFLTRLLEILPGSLAWGTIILAPILAYSHPVWISLYIIIFDVYWFLKGANVATHLIHSYRELAVNNKINWQGWLGQLQNPRQFELYLQERLSQETDKGLKKLYTKELEQLRDLPT